MIVLLGLLYPIAIQSERGPLWAIFLSPIVFVTLVIDVWVNYTEASLIFWEFPRKGEYTVSQRLERLQYDLGWRGDIARVVVPILNYIAPSGQHIKP